jgi:hypothetical protein
LGQRDGAYVREPANFDSVCGFAQHGPPKQAMSASRIRLYVPAPARARVIMPLPGRDTRLERTRRCTEI